MFNAYFVPEPSKLNAEAMVARRRRRREVENALLSHLMSGFKPTREAISVLQCYIDGEKSRALAFSILYQEGH